MDGEALLEQWSAMIGRNSGATDSVKDTLEKGLRDQPPETGLG